MIRLVVAVAFLLVASYVGYVVILLLRDYFRSKEVSRLERENKLKQTLTKE